MKIKKILVATDGSQTAKKAGRFAVDLAKSLHASVIIVSIVDERALISQAVPTEIIDMNIMQRVEAYMKVTAKRYTGQVQKLCEKNQVKSQSIVIVGHPTEDIVQTAHKTKADLIVLGSHGRSAIAAAVLGSVSYGIIHKDTSIPVLVVRR